MQDPGKDCTGNQTVVGVASNCLRVWSGYATDLNSLMTSTVVARCVPPSCDIMHYAKLDQYPCNCLRFFIVCSCKINTISIQLSKQHYRGLLT